MITNGKEGSIRSRIHPSGGVLILAALPLALSSCVGGGLFSRTDLVRATPSDSEIIWRDFATHDDPVNTITMEGDDLWMGTMKRIIRFNPRKSEYEIFTPENTGGGFASKGVYIISVDPKGNKWVGTYGGGLSRFDGEKWERFSNADGLGDNWIYDIVYDRDGVMWVATWDGLSVFDGERFKTYSVSDGLTDKWVYSIALDLDPEGRVWASTNGGASWFDGTRWRTIDKSKGLQDENVLSILFDKRNRRWFGTTKGLSVFRGSLPSE